MINKILLALISLVLSVSSAEERGYKYQTNEQLQESLKTMGEAKQLVVGGCTSLRLNDPAVATEPKFGFPITLQSQLWDKTPGEFLTGNVQVESGADFYCNAFKPWETVESFPCLQNAGFERVLINFIDQEPIFNIAYNSFIILKNETYEKIFKDDQYAHVPEYNGFPFIYMNKIADDNFFKDFSEEMSDAVGQSFAYWIHMLKPGGRFEYRSFEFQDKPNISKIQDVSNQHKLNQTGLLINNQTYPVRGHDGESTFKRQMHCYNLLSATSAYLSDPVLNIYKKSLIKAGLIESSLSIQYVRSVEILIDRNTKEVGKAQSYFLRFQGKKPTE